MGPLETCRLAPSGRGLGYVPNFEISPVLARRPEIGPGERAQFRNFGTPSISLGRMKPRFSKLVRTWSLGCSCTRITNWPRSGRGLEYVPNFEFLGPPQHQPANARWPSGAGRRIGRANPNCHYPAKQGATTARQYQAVC